ncbi:hypothetical protein [Plebeiibacterium sediminum]|uniref:Uncharacterized protein n=1 Tax=Plebeiibacterium sediminum TaxID=2992112 RepID=A0AAE3M8E7_9BACT|nr:hypothetical protein [Plebeiobacterium sediminum]MCW3788720.1 hypothetical protein [Plebeiobacterium sediminum]
MQQLKGFLDLLKKNRIIIYVMLGLALTMQVCSIANPGPEKVEEGYSENAVSQYSEQPLQQPEVGEKPQTFNFNSLWLMLVVTLVFYVAKRKGWLDKIMPQLVIFRVGHYKVKSNGNLALRVFIINQTKRDITFNAPSIQFYKGSSKREFAIKNIGGHNYFPLTLMPGTGHKFTIDAQKFYNNVDGLNDYKTIAMQICTNTGKCYKSIKWPASLAFRKL